MKTLRSYIRYLLEKSSKTEGDAELITEPDEAEGREEKEVSSGGVAGVSVPLGAGPHYPAASPKKKTKKSK